jgi:hypothetical protein
MTEIRRDDRTIRQQQVAAARFPIGASAGNDLRASYEAPNRRARTLLGFHGTTDQHNTIGRPPPTATAATSEGI